MLVSFANAAYLFTRRRRYHLVLRQVRSTSGGLRLCVADDPLYQQDPISSPNARSAMLNFSPPKPKLSLVQSLKHRVATLFGYAEDDEPHQFQIQQLDVWTPDYVKWSLRIFRCGSLAGEVQRATDGVPATASTRRRSHSCTTSCRCPTSFPPSSAEDSSHFRRGPKPREAGGDATDSSSSQTFALVYLYSTLVSDRAALQSEVMHEYNAKVSFLPCMSFPVYLTSTVIHSL